MTVARTVLTANPMDTVYHVALVSGLRVATKPVPTNTALTAILKPVHA